MSEARGLRAAKTGEVMTPQQKTERRVEIAVWVFGVVIGNAAYRLIVHHWPGFADFSLVAGACLAAMGAAISKWR